MAFRFPVELCVSGSTGPRRPESQGGASHAYDAKFTQLWGQHDAQFIRQGLPRAGQIIVFDNGVGRPANVGFSSILQLNPFDSRGGYIKELDAGYGADINALPQCPPFEINKQVPNGRNVLRPSKLISWNFNPTMGMDFFSPFIGGVQRFPNWKYDHQLHERSRL